MGRKCSVCNKQKSTIHEKIHFCGKCHNFAYCSQGRQKQAWPDRKKVCNDPSPPNKTTRPENPFAALLNNTWLHSRSEKEVFGLLIDVYRMRIEEQYAFKRQTDSNSLYDNGNPMDGFTRFLIAFTFGKKIELYPPWWSSEKHKQCLEFARQSIRDTNWHSLSRTIRKADVSEHYRNSMMPMQLRIFAEKIYGTGIGGADGTTMAKMLAYSPTFKNDTLGSQPTKPVMKWARIC